MISSLERLIATSHGSDDVQRLLRNRIGRMRAELDYVRLVEALKQRGLAAALTLVVRRPSLLTRLYGWFNWQTSPNETAATHEGPRPPGRTVVLTDAPPARFAPEGADVVTVPGYLPPDAPAWDASPSFAAWQRVATLALEGAAFIPDGAAGKYAAD